MAAAQSAPREARQGGKVCLSSGGEGWGLVWGSRQLVASFLATLQCCLLVLCSDCIDVFRCVDFIIMLIRYQRSRGLIIIIFDSKSNRLRRLYSHLSISGVLPDSLALQLICLHDNFENGFICVLTISPEFVMFYLLYIQYYCALFYLMVLFIMSFIIPSCSLCKYLSDVRVESEHNKDVASIEESYLTIVPSLENSVTRAPYWNLKHIC